MKPNQNFPQDSLKSPSVTSRPPLTSEQGRSDREGPLLTGPRPSHRVVRAAARTRGSAALVLRLCSAASGCGPATHESAGHSVGGSPGWGAPRLLPTCPAPGQLRGGLGAWRPGGMPARCPLPHFSLSIVPTHSLQQRGLQLLSAWAWTPGRGEGQWLPQVLMQSHWPGLRTPSRSRTCAGGDGPWAVPELVLTSTGGCPALTASVAALPRRRPFLTCGYKSAL